MTIVKANIEQAKKIAEIISESNKAVAKRFDITYENNPKHPSFYTAEWVASDFERGEKYFVAEHDGNFIGCVAFESPEPTLAYLNRLSVLPQYRRMGVGEKLVKHLIDYSNLQGVETVSIGIIAKFTELKNWYIKLGFIEGETKTFSHLPFQVMYLSFTIK